ncbi:MAG: tetratricopeptide repeat protein [Cyclobacteriaceae bacterium]
MKRLLYLVIMFFAFSVAAQPGWNWPSDPELDVMAKEKQAFYKVSMGLENWDDSFQALKWLYKNNPNLNKSIYIDGVKSIENLLKSNVDESRVSGLQDTLLLIHDWRIDYFGEKGNVLDRKAFAAFKMYYNKPAKYQLLTELYEAAYQEAGVDLSTFNLSPYMTLAKYYHQRDKDSMTAEMVLEIHTRLSNIIDYKMENNQPEASSLQKEMDRIDALLSSIPDLLSCEYISESLVPKLTKYPDDLKMAKKIFSYSLKAKCSGEPYFVQAAELIFVDEPTYDLAYLLGNRKLTEGELDEAIKYFQQARDLSEEIEDTYESLIALAKANSQKGAKIEARSFAKEAIAVKPGDMSGYNIIGNLYFTSSESCAGKESITKDRSLFIAAYNMYQKAGNSEQMLACKEQFPSKEEIFNENYEAGDKIIVECWINETVSLATRD